MGASVGGSRVAVSVRSLEYCGFEGALRMWSGVPFAAVKALLRMFPISNSGQVVLAEVRLARVVAGGGVGPPWVRLLAGGRGGARKRRPRGIGRGSSTGRWGGARKRRPRDSPRHCVNCRWFRWLQGLRGSRRVVCCASFPLLRLFTLRYAPFSRTVKGERA